MVTYQIHELVSIYDQTPVFKTDVGYKFVVLKQGLSMMGLLSFVSHEFEKSAIKKAFSWEIISNDGAGSLEVVARVENYKKLK